MKIAEKIQDIGVIGIGIAMLVALVLVVATGPRFDVPKSKSVLPKAPAVISNVTVATPQQVAK